MSGEPSATTESISTSRADTNVAGALVLVWAFPRAIDALTLPAEGAASLVVGRDVSCDVVLEGSDVSRRHVSFTHEAGRGLVVRDLESRNGLWVNGRRVPEALLAVQDVVRIGGWLGVVAADRAPFRAIFEGLWGGGTLRAALAPLARAAPSMLPIVLEGETGTGKEVVARAIHGASGRRGPFLAINCGAVPEALAESELFGHRKGAFTGAERASAGIFRSAEGGTLLLDEISDLPPAVQTKLLRVLEEGAVQPLGEARPEPIDVRVVAAGQGSLRRAVTEGRFRADLLARLDGLTVRLPPLRERREDVLPLFRHWLAEARAKAPEGVVSSAPPELEPAFVETLVRHDWPFNVRELVFLVRRLVTLHGHLPRWSASLLPEGIAEAVRGPEEPRTKDVRSATADAPSVARQGGELSLRSVLAALRTAGGNVAQAAAMLGVSRQRLYRLMEASDVDLASLRQEPRELG